MKKLITIFLLFSYLLFNAGLAYSLHFCGDQLTSSDFFASKKGCACSAEEKHECCKDLHIESGSDDHQVNSLYKVNFERTFLTEINLYLVEVKQYICSSFSLNLNYNTGPPNYKVPLFILNQIFRL